MGTSHKEAFKLYKRALDCGITDALYHLGYCYEVGYRQLEQQLFMSTHRWAEEWNKTGQRGWHITKRQPHSEMRALFRDWYE